MIILCRLGLPKLNARLIASSCLIWLTVFRTAGAVLVEYDIANAGGDSSFVAPSNVHMHTSAENLSSGPGIDQDATPDGYEDSTGLLGAFGWTDQAALDANDYFEFKVTPEMGYEITYDMLSYGLFREKTQTFDGPGTWDVQFSLDGFATAGTHLSSSSVSVGAEGTLNQDNFSINVSTIGSQTGAVTFRFFGYNRMGNANSYGGFGNVPDSTVDSSMYALTWTGTGADVQLTGTVSAVPEPAHYATVFGLLALLGAIAFRSKRRNALRC